MYIPMHIKGNLQQSNIKVNRKKQKENLLK